MTRLEDEVLAIATKEPSCYDCQHMKLCKLRYALVATLTGHIAMVNTENGEQPNACEVFASIAKCCKEFKRQ